MTRNILQSLVCIALLLPLSPTEVIACSIDIARGDIPGFDIQRRITNVKDFRTCSNACDEVHACKSWLFNSKKGYCYLKDKRLESEDRFPCKECVSGLKRYNGTGGECNWDIGAPNGPIWSSCPIYNIEDMVNSMSGWNEYLVFIVVSVTLTFTFVHLPCIILRFVEKHRGLDKQVWRSLIHNMLAIKKIFCPHYDMEDVEKVLDIILLTALLVCCIELQRFKESFVVNISTHLATELSIPSGKLVCSEMSLCGPYGFCDRDLIKHAAMRMGYSYLTPSGQENLIDALCRCTDRPELGSQVFWLLIMSTSAMIVVLLPIMNDLDDIYTPYHFVVYSLMWALYSVAWIIPFSFYSIVNTDYFGFPTHIVLSVGMVYGYVLFGVASLKAFEQYDIPNTVNQDPGVVFHQREVANDKF